MIKNAEAVLSAKIAGKYDPKNLEFIKITTTELSKKYLMEYNERNGEVLIAMASAKAVNAETPIISNQTSKHVTLKIYNALGQEVQTLMNEQKEPGYYTVTWDGIDNQGCEVSSGIYFYRLWAENFAETNTVT